MDPATGSGREVEDEEKLREDVMERESEVEVEVQDRGDGGEGGGEDEESSVNLVKSMTQKLATEPVKVRVHDIEIKGNTKTKDSVIEAQLKELREVTTMQELLQESVRANSRLRALGIFDKCVITLDAGPEELPGTVIGLPFLLCCHCELCEFAD
jgi:outer membrane protein insertion porin family